MTVSSCTSQRGDQYVIVAYSNTRLTYTVDPFAGMLSEGDIPNGTQFRARVSYALDNGNSQLVVRVNDILRNTFQNVQKIADKLNWGSMGASVDCISNFMKKITESNARTSLDLNDCGLDNLPTQVCALQNLRELDLSNNNLLFLPVHLQGLSALQTLDLRGNPIVELPDWLEREGLEILHDLPVTSFSQLAQPH